MQKSHPATPFRLLALAEIVLVTGAFLLVDLIAEPGGQPLSSSGLLRAGGSAAVLIATMYAVGLYNWRYAGETNEVLVRLGASVILTVLTYAMLAYLSLGLAPPPHKTAAALAVSVAAIISARIGFFRLCDLDAFKAHVLVIGAGQYAKRLSELETQSRDSRIKIVGFLDCGEKARQIQMQRIWWDTDVLGDYTILRGIDEIVVAPDDRRGNLPVNDLMRAHISGIAVTDYQTFCERLLGRVDINALKPSWFLYSEGVRQNAFGVLLKRGFDVVLSFLLLLFFLPVLIIAAISIKLDSPGPVLYRQNRVGLGGVCFVLVKLGIPQ